MSAAFLTIECFVLPYHPPIQLRWSQAWMLLALATLKAELDQPQAEFAFVRRARVGMTCRECKCVLAARTVPVHD